MKKRAGTFLQEKSSLECKRVTGKPEPKAHPETLTLNQIKMHPEVFQHRTIIDWISEPHIKELTKALESGQPLEAITVWWNGKNWTCIDGHHRIEAYRKVIDQQHSIPVKVFSGSVDDAITKAAAGNTKDKLPMSRNEKREAAWRLTIGTEMSKAEVQAVTGTSDRTIGNMRLVKGKLLKAHPEADLSELSWLAALAQSKGKESVDIDWDERNEEQAQELAKQLAKHLPKKTRRSPEILARAIEIYDTRLASGLYEYWNTEDPDDED